jgi:hypothetical protein
VPAVARVVLLVGGMAMLLTGLALALLGLFAGAWIRLQLPQVVISASAVGGAAFTLGMVMAVAGAIQLVIAASLRRASRWLMAGAAVLAGFVASLLLASAVAAATEVARGGTFWLLAASPGLAAAGIGYGVGAWNLGRASGDLPHDPG